jgi:hypothetical protein
MLGHGRVAVGRPLVSCAKRQPGSPRSSSATGDVGVAGGGSRINGAMQPSAARGETSAPRSLRERTLARLEQAPTAARAAKQGRRGDPPRRRDGRRRGDAHLWRWLSGKASPAGTNRPDSRTSRRLSQWLAAIDQAIAGARAQKLGYHQRPTQHPSRPAEPSGFTRRPPWKARPAPVWSRGRGPDPRLHRNPRGAGSWRCVR